MWVEKTKAFAYRVPIGDYNYLQCTHKMFFKILILALSKDTTEIPIYRNSDPLGLPFQALGAFGLGFDLLYSYI